MALVLGLPLGYESAPWASSPFRLALFFRGLWRPSGSAPWVCSLVLGEAVGWTRLGMVLLDGTLSFVMGVISSFLR